ncbi:MAG: SpoIID/LytB domain-containing protein [Candidatus Sumerlaeaceae bacterium]
MLRCRFSIVLMCLCLTLVGGIGAALEKSSAPRRDTIFARRGFIKVLLPSISGTATIRTSGPSDVSCGSQTVRALTGSVTVTGSGGSLAASESGKALLSGTTLQVGSPRPGSMVQLPSGSYRGMVELSRRGGSIRVLNVLLIDEWLKGVLPAEIGGDSAPEALKAQAVAARSEAIFRLASPPHASEGYDFCAGEHCQAYKGTRLESPTANQACDDTLGVVLLSDGDVLNGVYHNLCGGVTAGAEDVWESPPMPGLVPVFDDPAKGTPNLGTDEALAAFLQRPRPNTFCDCANRGCADYAKKYYRWTKTLNASALSRATGVSRIRDVRVTERRASGRVRKLTIYGDSGSKTMEKELPIRRALDLWSGLFVVTVEKTDGHVRSATFTGAGNGHGVGLCQHGAREMALRGASYQQILAHYYRGAEIEKIYRP